MRPTPARHGRTSGWETFARKSTTRGSGRGSTSATRWWRARSSAARSRTTLLRTSSGSRTTASTFEEPRPPGRGSSFDVPPSPARDRRDRPVWRDALDAARRSGFEDVDRAVRGHLDVVRRPEHASHEADSVARRAQPDDAARAPVNDVDRPVAANVHPERGVHPRERRDHARRRDRKSTRLNSSHTVISYAVFCLKKKKKKTNKKKKTKKKTKKQKRKNTIQKK